MDWANLELTVYSKDSDKADGLICLPNDQVLHKISLVLKDGSFKLGNDPYNGKVNWTIKKQN